MEIETYSYLFRSNFMKFYVYSLFPFLLWRERERFDLPMIVLNRVCEKKIIKQNVQTIEN